MIGALVGVIVAAVVAVVVFALVTALFGVVFGLAIGLMALALKVLPFLLVGWLVVKLVQRVERPRGLSAADRAWLDTRV
jgi:predicted membrane channel-forming protein YqfA (hemolysin III family)